MRHLASGLAILLLLAGCRGGATTPNAPLIKSQPELTNGNGVISVGGGNVVGNVGVKTNKPSTVQPGAAPMTSPVENNPERVMEPENEASNATDALAASDATAPDDLSVASL